MNNIHFIVKFQETASMEMANNILPSVVSNETECPEIQECDNANIGNGDLHFQPVNIQFYLHG